MTQQDISCGLDYAAVPDVKSCLTDAMQASYSFIVAPIVHPRLQRHNVSSSSGVAGFTRSDMLLSSYDWRVRIVGKLSAYLDVDAPAPSARQCNEDCLLEELEYCNGLALPMIMLRLNSNESSNLARIINSFIETSYQPSTMVWIHVPILSTQKLQESISQNKENNEEPWNEPWHWWSTFHERISFHKRVGVVLELAADVPPENVVKRWIGEPVKAVIVPTSIFFYNNGNPVLSQEHQHLVISLVEHDAEVIVSGARRSNIEHYVQYLHGIWQRRPTQVDGPMLAYARGWEDRIQTPLQPLSSNLDTYTYHIFEKDPFKYDEYQKAISKALAELQEKEINEKACDEKDLPNGTIADETQGDSKSVCEKVFTVMVLGAGRGPLVTATLNAADLTKTKVKVIAVEKNPCAVVALSAQAREEWRNRDVTVMAGDMRYVNSEEKADIIVSELLGSWGDNELSPECLDGAAGLLKPDGISIPCSYTSYVAPISSPKIWAAVKALRTDLAQPDKNLETVWVVYMQNKHDIGATKPVFTFTHPAPGALDEEGLPRRNARGLPATDNRRSCTLTWHIDQDNVVHGFAGYFECALFGGHALSIVPSTHSPGMISWFPVFIPIKTPLRVRRGDTLSATFWRCVDPRRVWYEWVASSEGAATSLHNVNGRSSEMLL